MTTTVNYNPYCQVTASFPIKQSINNGWTAPGVTGGMPQKFRFADGGASFATGRKVYNQFGGLGNLSNGANAGRYGPQLISAFAVKPGCCLSTTKLEKNPGNPLFRHVRELGKPVSGNKSMIVTADDYIQRKKNIAIGRGTSINLETNITQLGLKGYANQMSATQARRRTRSSGYVVPPKCRGHSSSPNIPGLCRTTPRPNGGPVTALYGAPISRNGLLR